MTQLAVTAIGKDAPGIVAAVTGVLVEEGCNVEDTSMTILGGHFAMMLVVAPRPGTIATTLERALSPVADRFGLVVVVRPIDDATTGPLSGERWQVSVYGADRPGIVHAVAQLLADAGVNIIDLETRVIGSSASPVYAMLLEVVLPAGVAATALVDALDRLASELGIECSAQPADADIL